MKTKSAEVFSFETKRFIAILATAILSLTAILGSGPAAFAGTNVDVYYSGNTIGTAVPPSITVDRDVVPLPSAASVTGSRTGYTFGGWSLTQGGEALSGSSYAFSSTASRLDLYAVWNTTISYNNNGADSGTLSTSRTSDTYRFGQTFTLPTAGTLVKSGFAFGGWMNSSVSTTRFTSYLAGATETGDRTFFAAWIKTVSFNANGATVGSIPSSMVYVNGGPRLVLPVSSEMTLRKPGYDFVGWSTTPAGKVTSNPGSYVPLVPQRTLYAIWKIQTTKASSRVFFKPGKSTLRASQKLILRDLADSLEGRTAISLSVAANRYRYAAKSLGKARNTAVVNYLRSLGVSATVSRTNTIGKGALSTALKNNRVTVKASWTNPTN